MLSIKMSIFPLIIDECRVNEYSMVNGWMDNDLGTFYKEQSEALSILKTEKCTYISKLILKKCTYI